MASVLGLSSCVVLGLAANFASEFLPTFHSPYIIYALIVPSVTLVSLLIILLRSTPGWDLIVISILWVLWLALSAWSADVIGFVECFSLSGQTTPTKNGLTSLQQYCYEMKSIEAFSWANFGVLLISFIVVLILTLRVASQGRYMAWNESISDLPWFGQWTTPYGPYGGQIAGQMPYGGYGQQPYVVQQVPGRSMVIQPNSMGGPTITQVPGNVV